MSSTVQKAEQTIGDQASYLSKDNLQRRIARVSTQAWRHTGLKAEVKSPSLHIGRKVNMLT